MATRRTTTTTAVAAKRRRGKRMSKPIREAEGEDALSPHIFWPANSQFDPNIVLLIRIFFIVGDKT
jgi:hypothetical protein